jgi:WD40 repeat protein
MGRLLPSAPIARTTFAGLLLAAVALINPLAAVAPPARPADPAEVAKLIRQLAADDYASWKRAAERLTAIGEPALPALRRVIKSREDVDVRLRAMVVARAIRKKLFGEIRSFGPGKGWVIRVAILPDGKQAVAGDFNQLTLWDLDTGKLVRRFGTGAAWGLALSRDGKRVLAGSSDNSVRLYEIATGRELAVLRGHTNQVWAAGLSPDGKTAITGAYDRTLRVWDVGTGRQLRLFEKVVDVPRCLAWSPDGAHVAVGHFTNFNVNVGTGTVRLWDVKTGKEVRAFPGHTGAVTAVAFSPDGKRLASSGFDRTVRVWDVKTGKELKRIEGHTASIDCVAWTPDGRRLLSCGNMVNDPTLRLWDAESGKELARYEGPTAPPVWVAVTPDGRRALTAGKDGMLRLWPLVKVGSP